MSEYATTQELALAVLSEIRAFHLVKYVPRWLVVFFLGLIDLDHLCFYDIVRLPRLVIKLGAAAVEPNCDEECATVQRLNPVLLVRALGLCWPEGEIKDPSRVKSEGLAYYNSEFLEHGQRDSLIARTIPVNMPANTN